MKKVCPKCNADDHPIYGCMCNLDFSFAYCQGCGALGEDTVHPFCSARCDVQLYPPPSSSPSGEK